MPPEAESPRRRFALPGLAWLAAGACAFAPLSGAVKRWLADELTLHAGLFAAGLALAFILVPLGAAWVVARFWPERRGAPVTAFYLTLAVVVGGLVFNAVRQHAQRDDVIAAQASALAGELKQTATGTGGGPGAATPQGGVTNVVNEAIVDAQKATKAHLYAMQLAYENAALAVAMPTFFDVRPLNSRTAIAERRADVETYTQAVRMWREAAELMVFHFTTELRDRRVPESAVHKTVAAYRDATEKSLPRLRNLRDKDAAIGLLLHQFLDFVEGELGAWGVRSEDGVEKVVFDRAEAQAKYQELLHTAKVLEDERRALRAEAAR